MLDWETWHTLKTPKKVLQEAEFPWLDLLELPKTTIQEPSKYTCDRCGELFQWTFPLTNACRFHWGWLSSRASTSKHSDKLTLDGKVRQYSCCLASMGERGCADAPHVFKESDMIQLHHRHPFQMLPTRNKDQRFYDFVALDCEMVRFACSHSLRLILLWEWNVYGLR
jgi:hypothetical protein